MKSKHHLLAALLLAFGIGAPAVAATSVTATVTADDTFSLWAGMADGSGLRSIGADSDDYWATPNTFTFNVAAGEYLYLLARDLYGAPHAWQGAFTTGAGTLNSSAAGWVGTAVASTTVSQAMISGASFHSLVEYPSNAGPWGDTVGNGSAKWVWVSDAHSNDGIALFRSAAPVVAVPEPESYAMFLAGLGLVGALARRRRPAA